MQQPKNIFKTTLNTVLLNKYEQMVLFSIYNLYNQNLKSIVIIVTVFDYKCKNIKKNIVIK
jgi:hypothetical protein